LCQQHDVQRAQRKPQECTSADTEEKDPTHLVKNPKQSAQKEKPIKAKLSCFNTELRQQVGDDVQTVRKFKHRRRNEDNSGGGGAKRRR
jgi:hypothetical protein